VKKIIPATAHPLSFRQEHVSRPGFRQTGI
jgi:hypothetical protein